ncbi:MAG: hypothetical protein N2169_08075, partial [bacterium]|nr:hypothetical protein [bacterium]
IARKNVDNRLDPYELFLILIDKNNKRTEEKIPSYIIPYDIGCYKGNIILFNTDFGDNKTILIFDRSIKKSKMIRIGGDIDFIKGYEIDNELLFYYKRGKIGLFYWEDEQRE